jgi:hypothetical protein
VRRTGFTAKTADFVPKDGVISVIIVQPYAPSFPGLIKRLDTDSSVQACECSAALEVASVARKAGSAIIVAHISTDADIVSMASLLKLLAQKISQRKVRTVITSKVRKPSVVQTLNHYGATEIIPEPINERALALKIDRHIHALRNTISTNGEAQKRDEKERESEENRKRAESKRAANASEPQIKIVDALTVENDVWCTSKERPKRIAGKWSILFFGFPPALGKWVKNGEKGGEALWQWNSTSEFDPFAKMPGIWNFAGQHPEFKGDRWLFVAKSPRLDLILDGKSLGAKVSTEASGDMRVATDSKQGIAAQDKFRKALLQLAAHKKKSSQQENSYEDQEDPEEMGDLELKKGAGGSGSGSGGSKVKKVPALKLESDFWLAGDRDPICVSGRWSIKLVGPGPMAGRWVGLETDKGTEQFWQWTPTDAETDIFIKEQGAWIFRGSSPRFDNDRWMFVGKRPSLGFYYEGQSYGEKVTLDEAGNLLLAEDSPAAHAAFSNVQATLVKVIRNDAKNTNDEEDDGVRIMKDGEKSKDHEGESEEGSEFRQISAEKRSADDENALESVRRVEDRSSDEEDDRLVQGRKSKVRVDQDGEPEDLGKVIADKDGNPEEIGKVLSDEEAVESIGSVRRKKRRGEDGDQIITVTADNEADGPEESGDLFYRKAKAKAKESKELSLDLGQENESKEISATIDREKEGKELSLDLGKEREGKELSLDLGKEAEAKELSAAMDKTAEGKELEYRGSEEESARGITDHTGEVSSAQAQAEAEKAAQEEASADVVPERPGDAVLSPIALAFLLSELMCKRDLELGALTSRYCTYLSAAVHGRRVEFWAERAGGDTLWVASHDGKPGSLSPEKVTGQVGVSVASVRGGKFVFGALKKTDIPVSEKFLEAVSRISKGVGLAWREKFQPSSAEKNEETKRAA